MTLTSFPNIGHQGTLFTPALAYDTTYMYLLVLNETVQEGMDYRDGRLLVRKTYGKKFKGSSKTFWSGKHMEKKLKVVVKHFGQVDLW